MIVSVFVRKEKERERESKESLEKIDGVSFPSRRFCRISYELLLQIATMILARAISRYLASDEK